jgi:aspartate kinase
MTMIVQKFGGTSMGDASSIIDRVSSIVIEAATSGECPVVVVSAMSGVTSSLLDVAKTATTQGRVDKESLERIKARHRLVLEHPAFGDGWRAECERFVEDEFKRLESLLSAIVIIGELPVRSQDAIIAVGEKLSAHMLASVLNSRGTRAQYVTTDAIVPSHLRYDSDAYWDEIEALFRECMADIPQSCVPVVPGFFGPTDRGILDSVGRGYSDYTACLLGGALEAREIQIWTDVDGVFSANPRVVDSARILDRISYDEMAELAHFGAKILHPFSVRPAVKAGVPIKIVNTFKREAPGTIVQVEHVPTDTPFKSIAYKRDVTSVRITTPRMLMTHGFLAKVGSALERHRTSIDLIATSEVSISFTIDERLDRSSPLFDDLSVLGEVSTLPRQAIISLVGNEIARSDDLLARTFSSLQRAEISANLISFGDMKINLSLLVEDDMCERAVRALHEEFFG